MRSPAKDINAYPPGVVCTPKQQRKARKDLMWSRSREQLFAAAAASVHLAIFAYNLAFWGFEGMPPDRYWPDNTRYEARAEAMSLPILSAPVLQISSATAKLVAPSPGPGSLLNHRI